MRQEPRVGRNATEHRMSLLSSAGLIAAAWLFAEPPPARFHNVVAGCSPERGITFWSHSFPAQVSNRFEMNLQPRTGSTLAALFRRPPPFREQNQAMRPAEIIQRFRKRRRDARGVAFHLADAVVGIASTAVRSAPVPGQAPFHGRGFFLSSPGTARASARLTRLADVCRRSGFVSGCGRAP